MKEVELENSSIPENCLLNFLDNLYGRPIDSLSDEEMAKLQSIYVGGTASQKFFKCQEV